MKDTAPVTKKPVRLTLISADKMRKDGYTVAYSVTDKHEIRLLKHDEVIGMVRKETSSVSKRGGKTWVAYLTYDPSNPENISTHPRVGYRLSGSEFTMKIPDHAISEIMFLDIHCSTPLMSLSEATTAFEKNLGKAEADKLLAVAEAANQRSKKQRAYDWLIRAAKTSRGEAKDHYETAICVLGVDLSSGK